MQPTLFVSTDVDEANVIANEIFYESHFEPVPDSPLPFKFELNVATAGSMTFGIVSHGCEITARAGGQDMSYGVGIALKGAFPMKFGQEDVTADQFTAAIHTPVSNVRMRGFPTGTEQLFLLSFGREALDNQLRNLLGRDRIGVIKLAPSLDLRSGLGAQWWRMASSLAFALQSQDELITNPLMTTQLSSSVMTGLLLAADHPYRADLEAWTQPVPPAVVRKAMDIIESGAHLPLTIVDVAAEVGCSVRALQAGYRRYLNLTPREHIRLVRMDRAHTMLQAADPTTNSVSKVAAMWGFHHPGRFAIDYRKIYGVSPSTTLRSK